ncbi:MAG TPA: topoisomerase C-terminal repeat-containing protein [Burkholderiaceae bacterium]|nr:topoisomerase C-terminal repeat-containing protein [Burkholderiaceae bacterium]
MFELPMAYVCENAVGPSKTCDFRSGRVILQQTVTPEQMRKLLAEGRTDLLRDFVSNRTRRKFAARLVRKPDGTTGFEFEPRAPRAAKQSTATQAAPSSALRASKGERASEGKPAQTEEAEAEAPVKPVRPTKKAAKSPARPSEKASPSPKKAVAKGDRRKTAAKDDKKKPARRNA